MKTEEYAVSIIVSILLLGRLGVLAAHSDSRSPPAHYRLRERRWRVGRTPKVAHAGEAALGEGLGDWLQQRVCTEREPETSET